MYFLVACVIIFIYLLVYVYFLLRKVATSKILLITLLSHGLKSIIVAYFLWRQKFPIAFDTHRCGFATVRQRALFGDVWIRARVKQARACIREWRLMEHNTHTHRAR